MNHHEDLRHRLLGAVRCASLDSAALADELFDAVVRILRRVLNRPTAELELLFADLRLDLERRIKMATSGMVDVAAVIDDVVRELMGSAPRG